MSDDLTRIKGIGPAARGALAQVGIASFAALAAVDPAHPPAIEGLRADWPDWVEQARALVMESQQNPEGDGDSPVRQPDQDAGEPTHVRITATRDGFRRAGMAHSRTPTEHPIGRFSTEQLDALMAEPRLVVELVRI